MSALKWLFGGLGWVIGGGPIGAILGVILGSLFEGIASSSNKTSNSDNFQQRTSARSQSRPTSSAADIRISLLILIACVMKADGHVRKTELDLVKRFLIRNYGEQGALEALQVLKAILIQDIDPLAVATQISQNVNYSTRLELLHFLFDLANADNEVLDSEIQMIQTIANGLHISPVDFQALAALYNRVSDTNWAYTALEVEPTATDDEVKKAYRRMAMKYHPDKVASAGDEIKEKATEKFRAINEAYEHIKQLRGIN